MLLDTDRDRIIDFLGKKIFIFCQTHIAVGHRIQGGRPGPLRLPSAAGRRENDNKRYLPGNMSPSSGHRTSIKLQMKL